LMSTSSSIESTENSMHREKAIPLDASSKSCEVTQGVDW
jgi:hypothetical protein